MKTKFDLIERALIKDSLILVEFLFCKLHIVESADGLIIGDLLDTGELVVDRESI